MLYAFGMYFISSMNFLYPLVKGEEVVLMILAGNLEIDVVIS